MLNRPIRFQPYYKSVIWGGDVIAVYKGEPLPCPTVGESWEVSGVPGQESVVVGDPELQGLTISELMRLHGADLLGEDADPEAPFPLLVKIIDAHHDLSLQVHPSDALALERHASPGKSEMWYMVSCRPGARIYCGLDRPLTPEEYDRRVAEGTVMQAVASHEARAGQFYYVPAGTLHAIGAGCLLVEVQQTSDITYRVYDYDRRDADGRPRPLHTAEARDAIDYTYPPQAEPMARVVDGTAANVVSCPYFSTSLLSLRYDDTVTIDLAGRTFAILVVVEGSMQIHTPGRTTYCTRGHTLLLPADLEPSTLSGSSKALLITC